MSERPVADRIAGLIEQIKRDVAVLKGPPQYVAERQFYEDRIAGCRADIAALERRPQ